jgi:hypothetical protein
MLDVGRKSIEMSDAYICRARQAQQKPRLAVTAMPDDGKNRESGTSGTSSRD